MVGKWPHLSSTHITAGSHPLRVRPPTAADSPEQATQTVWNHNPTQTITAASAPPVHLSHHRRESHPFITSSSLCFAYNFWSYETMKTVVKCIKHIHLHFQQFFVVVKMTERRETHHRGESHPFIKSSSLCSAYNNAISEDMRPRQL